MLSDLLTDFAYAIASFRLNMLSESVKLLKPVFVYRSYIRSKMN